MFSTIMPMSGANKGLKSSKNYICRWMFSYLHELLRLNRGLIILWPAVQVREGTPYNQALAIISKVLFYCDVNKLSTLCHLLPVD